MLSEKQVGKIKRLVKNYERAVLAKNDGMRYFTDTVVSSGLNKFYDDKVRAKAKLDAYLFSLVEVRP